MTNATVSVMVMVRGIQADLRDQEAKISSDQCKKTWHNVSLIQLLRMVESSLQYGYEYFGSYERLVMIRKNPAENNLSLSIN